MKLFVVNYKGLWLGGKAIVWADTEDQAIELVRQDPNTQEFTNISVEEIPPGTVVIHNDNGDY